MKKVINLHQHSNFSILDAIPSPKEIVDKTVEYELPSVAITDHGNMNNYGIFYNECNKKGIKPILGCEFYHIKSLDLWNKKYSELFSVDKKGSKEEVKKLKRRNHLVLLVKNNNGFKNINQLIYYAYKNMYYKPRIDRKLLEQYSDGLILCTACLGGEIQSYLENKDIEGAQKSVEFFKSIFKNDLYFEIQFNEIEAQRYVNLKMIELANRNKIKLVITQDNHYINPEDYKTHQTLLLLQNKKTYRDLKDNKDGVWQFEAKELFYKNYKTLLESCKKYNPEITIKQFDEYCENTLEIDSKIEKFQIDTSIKLKNIDSKIKDKDEYLRKICLKSLKEKKLGKEYLDRLNFELQVVKDKNLSNYFLIVSGIIDNAKNKMIVGAGRGSGSGSLINYLLKITEIDPIKYKLYFERFLSTQRKDYPDIDVDFENNDDVKNDLISRFGSDVACISSYNTFQLFALLKDLGRVYGLESPDFFDKLNKSIRIELAQSSTKENEEEILNLDYETLINSSNTLKTFLDENDVIVNDLKNLLGKIRHIGKHAAGVIISDNLIQNQPTMIIDGILQTSLSEGVKDKDLSNFGFVKIDILGLKTLKVIDLCLKYIVNSNSYNHYEVYNRLIHPDKINLEDKKVYDFVFNKFNLIGIFQFETDSIRSMIQRTNPDCFQDLVAINALFRPGPLASGMAYEYGDRKKGKININYFDNKIVQKVLEKTYGILCYQEQVMELGHYLGNLSLDDTNVLRKLLMKFKKGDKKQDELEKLKKKFFIGAKNNGMIEENIKLLWENMIAFAAYGFNLAHSTAYSMIAYQTAWLKTYYPIQFYCALLNVENIDNYEKIVNEMKRNNIPIKLIDLNNCEVDFSIKNNKIYWGLSKILGIGEKASFELVKARNVKSIKGLKDFLLRRDIDWRICNKRIVETLIKINAFSDDNSKVLVEVFQEYNNFKNHIPTKQESWKENDRNTKLNTIFKNIKQKYLDNKKSFKFSFEENSQNELKFYRLNILYSAFDIKDRMHKIKKLKENGNAGGFYDNLNFVITQFRGVYNVKDKRNQNMCFLDLIDIDGNVIKGIIFSSNYKKQDIIQNNIYCVNGHFSNDKFIVEKYYDIDNILKDKEEAI